MQQPSVNGIKTGRIRPHGFQVCLFTPITHEIVCTRWLKWEQTASTPLIQAQSAVYCQQEGGRAQIQDNREKEQRRNIKDDDWRVICLGVSSSRMGTPAACDRCQYEVNHFRFRTASPRPSVCACLPRFPVRVQWCVWNDVLVSRK